MTFPLTEKLEVNGHARHPLYELLTVLPDQSGAHGDVEWNFEKFLVSPRGEPIARFRPTTLPEAAELVEAIEQNLPGHASPEWSTIPATDVAPGDRVLVAGVTELTVSRIEHPFLGRDDVICLIEDTAVRWLAQPVQAAADVNVLR